jgi:hypothetical protein
MECQNCWAQQRETERTGLCYAFWPPRGLKCSLHLVPFSVIGSCSHQPTEPLSALHIQHYLCKEIYPCYLTMIGCLATLADSTSIIVDQNQHFCLWSWQERANNNTQSPLRRRRCLASCTLALSRVLSTRGLGGVGIGQSYLICPTESITSKMPWIAWLQHLSRIQPRARQRGILRALPTEGLST